MQARYQHFFSINIRHDYFHDGKCREISVAPTNSTAQLMRQFELRLVERDGYFEVYFNAGRNANPFVSENTENFQLDFRLIVADYKFHNYTDLSFFDPQQEGWLSVQRASTDRFTINQVSEGIVAKVAPYSEEVEEEEEEEDDAIILTDGMQSNDFGLLSIEFPLAGGVAKDWIDENDIPNISLNFGGRSTIWRYYLIPQAGEYVQDSAKISGGEGMIGEVSFNVLPEKATLPDGSEAIVIQSSEPIALRDRYPEHLELSVNKLENGTALPLRLSLPNPSADRLNGRVAEETPTETDGFYSDQYIYL